MNKMSRRDVVRAGVAAGAAMAGGTSMASALGAGAQQKAFKLKYAPHFGMLEQHAGADPVEQLKFAAGEGFRAWEDNGMKGRPVAEQERLAKTMRDLGMTMGVFVVNMGTAWSPTLATGKQDALDKFVAECRESVDVAKRVGAKWMTVVPGMEATNLDPGYQLGNVIHALRRGAEIFEPHNLVMVLEPLNFRDHPGLFLTTVPQAYQVCRAVNSPACKVLFDIYHQQIQQGNIIPNIDLAWSEIAYFQLGDNPGRREPTSGEVNFRNIFRHIYAKGFQGVLGMEHGLSKPGKEGERALIDAYRWSDDF